MDTQTIAVIAAILGGLATMVFIALAVAGVRALKDIRDQLGGKRDES